VLRRFSQTVTGSQSIAASAVAVGFLGTSIALPKLDPTQALRVIAGSAFFNDAASSGKLSILASSAILGTFTGNLCRVYAGGIAGQIVGTNGVRWGWLDDEFIYGNDYLEICAAVGDPSGVFKINAGADVSNSDGAAAHVISSQLSLLIEIYQTVLESPV